MECPALTTAGLSAVTSASGSPRRARRWCRLRILDVEAEQVLVGTPRRLIQVLMKLPLITLLDGEHSLHASLSILHSSRFPFNFSLFIFHKISSTSTNFSKFACKTTDLFGLFKYFSHFLLLFIFYLSSTNPLPIFHQFNSSSANCE